MTPRKIVFRNSQSPGDGVSLAFAIRSLHETHPGKFITDVRCPYSQIFYKDPHVTLLDEADDDVDVIDATYRTIHQSNQKPYHFITSFMYDMEEQLGVKIEPTSFSGFLHIAEEEHYWYSAPYEILGKDVPYWVLNAGYKKDFTAKQWEFDKYQKVINSCKDVTFVQIGHVDASGWHVHPKLTGKNLISLVGKTDLRQLIRLVYNSFGVITPVSLPMMLSYGVPAHPRFNRKSRACVVLAGGREGNTWQQGPNQHLLHTCGMLPCCDMGGCWKSRLVPLTGSPELEDEKNESLCLNPVKTEKGQIVAKCMDMIKAGDVIKIVKQYMANLDWKGR